MTDCPRWQLQAPHYLNVRELQDGTKVEWEHKETNRANGRAVRKLHAVPLLLNPEDPNDHTEPGVIIVTQEVEGAYLNPRDLVFTGPPTRDMDPLNEAAEAESDKHRARWINPIETLPVNGGMSSQEQTFMENMMKAFAKEIGAQPQANASVSREAYDELQARLAKLEAMLAAQNNSAPAPRRA